MKKFALKIIILGMFFASFTPAFAQEQNENDFIIGKWKNELPIYEVYGEFYEDGVQNEKYKDIKFINSISFSKDYTGIMNLSDGTQVDFEYSIRTKGRDLTIAYGSKLAPNLDFYSIGVLTKGLFLKSKRLSKNNGTMYLMLVKEE